MILNKICSLNGYNSKKENYYIICQFDLFLSLSTTNREPYVKFSSAFGKSTNLYPHKIKETQTFKIATYISKRQKILRIEPRIGRININVQ